MVPMRMVGHTPGWVRERKEEEEEVLHVHVGRSFLGVFCRASGSLMGGPESFGEVSAKIL